MICIIDYQMGNLFSIQKKIKQLGYDVCISNKAEDIKSASKIILPGVGHFGKAMQNLNEMKLINLLHEEVVLNKKPILGICLGMQLMTKSSEEGEVAGLGWFDANVKKITINDTVKFKVPHTGWNQIKIEKESKLLKEIKEDSEFYFVHSYYVDCNNIGDQLTTTDYELKFTSSIEKNNIYGVQFHPEKSHEVGGKLLRNFIEL